MSTATMQPPVVPPRPTRSQDKDESAGSMPKVPPRPIKHRFDRPSSPDRFAPSPLNESPFLSRSPKATRSSPNNSNGFASESIERPGSVALPSVGEEGLEYDAVNEDRPSSPEQTRTVGDLKLHAPKPSLPAQSAKQRVAVVTRTDSDKAAAFGIGKPSSEEPSISRSSVKKKASASQISGSDSHFDDEQGIPEIGQRVPMNPFAGDIQAPSPAPVSGIAEGLKAGRHHGRRTSARGFVDLPPGSYGLHGHGVASSDKLDKQYYEKHPELLHREKSVPIHDRQNDFALPSSELNKIVRETASRGSGVGTTNAFGTPSEELGYQAQEELASRISSPQPTSSASKTEKPPSPLAKGFGAPEVSVTEPSRDDGVIHVDDSASRRRSYVQFNEDASGSQGSEDGNYTAPILAPDEVAKDPSPAQACAVEPPPERRGSAFEIDSAPSRPTSRPGSIYREVTNLSVSSPLEDVQEYEPLFPTGEKEAPKEVPSPEKSKPRHKFPSRDVWEDAPESTHYSAEVSTPDVDAQAAKPTSKVQEERTETPAIAFARHFEELAEKEPRKSSAPIKEKAVSEKPNWLPLQEPRFQDGRPSMSGRFPSRDVWEDTPDSLMIETTVGGPQQEEEQEQKPKPEEKPEKPQVPARPQKKLTDPTMTGKPAVPERPKPKPATSDDKASPDADKPKPVVPARPSKSLHSGSESREADASSKPKPAVPVRPMGSKIAALQAGFMSDLNNRLKLGPQAPKKEEPTATQDLTEEKEKAPLADARKGRARGPQRRAPGTSPSPAASLEAKEVRTETPSFSFTMPMTVWTVDPEEGSLNMSVEEKVEASEPVEEAAKTEDEPAAESETKTLASNMAGEAVVEATIEKEGDEVDVEDVQEVAKD